MLCSSIDSVWHRLSNTVVCWSLRGLVLSVEMEISGRAFTVWYYMELGGLWWRNVLYSAHPPLRHRPDTGLMCGAPRPCQPHGYWQIVREIISPLWFSVFPSRNFQRNGTLSNATCSLKCLPRCTCCIFASGYFSLCSQTTSMARSDISLTLEMARVCRLPLLGKRGGRQQRGKEPHLWLLWLLVALDIFYVCHPNK